MGFQNGKREKGHGLTGRHGDWFQKKKLWNSLDYWRIWMFFHWT
jgi:hypothetical protein